jgi:ligand-binding SRPBCC domain-containing protein
MDTYILERTQMIPLSRAETFSFFSEALNLERITPPYLKFKVITPTPFEMTAGRLIDYQLALFNISFRWRTLIEAWEPETRFVDRQINGPYSLWHHTHTFESIGPQQTLMRDVVHYRVEWGAIGGLVHEFFVRRMVNEIFDYRVQAVTEILKPGYQYWDQKAA